MTGDCAQCGHPIDAHVMPHGILDGDMFKPTDVTCHECPRGKCQPHSA